MITKQPFETLISTMNRESLFFQQDDEVNLKSLKQQSDKLCQNWNDYIVDNEHEINFKLDDDMKFIYKTIDGEIRKSDITEYAFGQLCTRVGVPANYVKKCFENNKINLAIQNFEAWSSDCEKKFLVREQNGVVRAILSDTFKTFDSNKVISTLSNTVNPRLYKANGVFLSADRFHIRFVHRNALDVDEKSPMFSGFSVSSSDVGKGSLKMQYFLYRQVCKNGMTVSDKGGTLFRQSHAGSSMETGKLDLFNKAFLNIEQLDSHACEMIALNQSIMLKDYELAMYLEKFKRELKLSEKSQEKLDYLIQSEYGTSRWGVLNSITELAQDFTLDTRIDFETFAGNTLFQKIA